MNKDIKICQFICKIIGVISIFLIIGTIGGLEENTLSIIGFLSWQLASWLGFTLSLIAYYKLQSIEDGRLSRGKRKAV